MIKDIEIHTASDMDGMIAFLRELRSNDPVFWSSRYNAWVITKYDDIKKILLDDVNFPMSYGNQIEFFNSSNYNDELLKDKENEYNKYYALVKYYSLYFKGMPTKKFTNKTIESLNSVFEKIEKQSLISLTNEINLPISFYFALNFLDINDSISHQYLNALENINSFTDIEGILRNITPITNKNIENFKIYQEFKKYFNNIDKPQHDYFLEILKNFINSQLTEIQISVTGAENAIMNIINVNNELFKELNYSEINNFLNESMRFLSFNAHTTRKSKIEIKLKNKIIKRNDNIILLLGSGNFDEEYFGSDSHIFNYRRKSLRRNMEFGFGPHFCIAHRAIKSHLYWYIKTLVDYRNVLSISNITMDSNARILGAPIKEVYGSIGLL